VPACPDVRDHCTPAAATHPDSARLGKRPGRHCELREEMAWSAWVEEGSNGDSTGFYCCQQTRERPEDGEGETEQRGRETGDAEWKLCPNRREWTDACVRVFPIIQCTIHKQTSINLASN
jgi:hypothetical protein